MNATQRDLIMQRWNVIQHELLPELRHDVGTLTPRLERVIHTLEWVRIEEFVTLTWCGIGRPPSERAWLANAFVAKAVLGLTTTAGLIERLTIDRALRRICGFPLCKGEIMAGNVLGKGYTAGVGMSIGTTFGRIAGKEAALAARKEARHETA